MERNHLVYGEEVNIEWEKSDQIDWRSADSCNYLLLGIGSDGNEYVAVGVYRGDELLEIENIEII